MFSSSSSSSLEEHIDFQATRKRAKERYGDFDKNGTDWYKIALNPPIALHNKVVDSSEETEYLPMVHLFRMDGYHGRPVEYVELNEGVSFGLSTPMEPFPLAQVTLRSVWYSPRTILLLRWLYNRRGETDYQVLDRFPTFDVLGKTLPVPFEFKRAGQRCDVFYSTTQPVSKESHTLIQKTFQKMAKSTRDYPVPNYQNIIDPNLYSIFPNDSKNMNQAHWVATDFLIEETVHPETQVSTLSSHYMSPIYDFSPEKDLQVYRCVKDVLDASLPLLARLRRPALLLPGLLQAVVKVQKIFLQPGEEYEGVWHMDGNGITEKIIAVVCYYYRVDESLHSASYDSGNLEFFDNTPIEPRFWVGGDCSPSSFSSEVAKKKIEQTAHCQVPIREGRLVVFSNYQMIHRVLRMYNGSGEVGARSFVCLFITDQRAPMPSTNLYPSFPPLSDRMVFRDMRLINQLKPCSRFGVDRNTVYSTGNGSVALIGWMRGRDYEPEQIKHMMDTSRGLDREGLIKIGALNCCPPISRGISWAAAFSPTDKFRLNLQERCWMVIWDNYLDTSVLPAYICNRMDNWLKTEKKALAYVGIDVEDYLKHTGETHFI